LSIQPGQQLGSGAHTIFPSDIRTIFALGIEPPRNHRIRLCAMPEPQSPRLIRGRFQHQDAFDIARPDHQKISIAVSDSGDDACTLVHREAEIYKRKGVCAHRAKRNPDRRTEKRDRRGAHGNRAHADDVPLAPSPELISITPRREFGPLRFSDSHKLETFAETGEADMLRRNTELRPAVRTLTLLNRLPPLFDGSQVPALALPAHHPQATLRRVECQPAPDRKMLDGFVGSELRVAEKARRVHSS
jgi:hypothetical protein